MCRSGSEGSRSCREAHAPSAGRTSPRTEVLAKLKNLQSRYSGNLPIAGEEHGTATGKGGRHLDRVRRFQNEVDEDRGVERGGPGGGPRSIPPAPFPIYVSGSLDPSPSVFPEPLQIQDRERRRMLRGVTQDVDDLLRHRAPLSLRPSSEFSVKRIRNVFDVQRGQSLPRFSSILEETFLHVNGPLPRRAEKILGATQEGAWR